MKLYFTLGLILIFTACQAQDQMSVKDGNPKKDEAFSKMLNTILTASGKDFADLSKQFVMKDITDSTWTIDLKLPGADEAKLTKSKESVILIEHFVFDNPKIGIDRLLEKVKASLPPDFKYSLNYDAMSGISDYTFTYDSKKVKHPGYPDEFHLNGDIHSATIGIMLFK